jgi:hypothetical protein
MEVTYRYYLGGTVTAGYQDNDAAMAQAEIDDACENATYIERQRIIDLLQFEYDRGDYEMGIVPYLIEQIEKVGN